jgi:hypothetical protein
MAIRYQHVFGQVRRDIAEQFGGLLWGDPPHRPGEAPMGDQTSRSGASETTTTIETTQSGSP